MADLIPAVISSSFTSAHPLEVTLTQFSPPMVQQPKLISLTLTPVFPSTRQFMPRTVSKTLFTFPRAGVKQHRARSVRQPRRLETRQSHDDLLRHVRVCVRV